MHRIVEGIAHSAQEGLQLRLLVASLRSTEDLARLAAEGLNTFTISPAIAAELFAVEPTLAAAAQFERDAVGG
jgi:transaldolase